MKMKFGFFAAVLIFVLSGCGSAPKPAPESEFVRAAQGMVIGSFVSGNLDFGQEIWYRVRTAQACILTVETEGDIDTYLEAYDAQRNLITENDDGPNGLNARINIAAKANTTYVFKLRGLHGEVSGPFRILVDSKPLNELRAGSPVSGNLAAQQEIWYSVRAVQSGYLTVETTGDTDTYITAYDENFVYITEDDDGTGTGNARTKLQVIAGKTYIFKLSGYSSAATGAYGISAVNQAYPVPTVLNIGSFINGNISFNEELWYSVRAGQTGTLVVEVSSSVDTTLIAYDDSYTYLAYDYNAEYQNVRIRRLVTSGKTLFFLLRGSEGDRSGTYRIYASIEPVPSPTPLTIGSFMSGNITPGGEYWFSVSPVKSGKLIVETTGGTDTYLDAYDSSYNILASNDDYSDQNAHIEIDAAANQTFIFLLRGYSTSTEGQYRLLASME